MHFVTLQEYFIHEILIGKSRTVISKLGFGIVLGTQD